MSQPAESYTSNLLLQAMSGIALDRLKPHLTRVEIHRQQVLVIAGQPIQYIYFLESGVASVVKELSETGRTEVGIFGREGVSGLNVVLGVDTSHNRTFIQVDGSTALRMEAQAFRDALQDVPLLQAILLKYVHTMFTQVMFSAISNVHHLVEARLARWLLMCHDRVDGDEIFLTHEFMSLMIGAQRTGVTVTLHILEGGGAIRSKRGCVIILDRERLEQLAGDAYGEPEADYRRLIGPFGRSLEAL